MSVLLLDVRTQAEYDRCHLPGARLIPTPLPPLTAEKYTNLGFRLLHVVQNVHPDTPIGVYCKKGIRAQAAVEILRHLGYHQTISLGGVDDPESLAGQICWG